MPDAVKACYRNLKKFSNGWNVVLLTKDNISDYIVLPNDVLKDVGKTKSFTHLSDYIRLALLSEYGGFWIDSTIYVTRPLPRPEDITPFFTIRNEVRDNKCIVCIGGSFHYCMFLQAQRGCNIFAICSNTIGRITNIS